MLQVSLPSQRENSRKQIPIFVLMNTLTDRIFKIDSEEAFSSLAIEIFRFQSETNKVYSKYLEYLKIDSNSIERIDQIPFLPIEFFKKFQVVSSTKNPECVFESSGTTGQKRSKHYVVSENLYKRSFMKAFSSFYGKPDDLCILALLPSYLERKNSSLVYMMHHLIHSGKHPDSGFYLNNLEELSVVLNKRISDKIPTLLIGVSFALLDLAEKFPQKLSKNIVLMETGGMKGRKKELIREELHDLLKKAFQIEAIHSEYGMTELLSQAYSKENGKFFCPPWMKLIIRDTYDPLSIVEKGQSGGINIIDLANLYSCCFIETEDLGKINEDGAFEILGRLDQSEIRGCNLMVV